MTWLVDQNKIVGLTTNPRRADRPAAVEFHLEVSHVTLTAQLMAMSGNANQCEGLS